MEDLEDQQQPAPAAPQVNEAAIAQAVLNRIAPQLAQLSPGGQQKIRDHVDSLVANYRSAGLDEGTIQELVKPARTAQVMMDEKLNAFGQQVAQTLASKELFNKGVEVVDSIFEKYDDDELVQEAEISLRNKVQERLKNDSAFMSNWSNGVWNTSTKNAIRKHSKEVIEGFLKKAGRAEAAQSATSPTIGKTNSASTARANRDQSPVLPESPDELNDHQKSMYLAGLTVAKQYLGKNDKKAQHEWAMAAASRVLGSPNARKSGRSNIVNF